MRSSGITEPLTVREVCDGIGEAIRAHLGSEVWVRGSISGLNRSANGHVYFTLIDPDEVGERPTAILGVALFANAKFQINAILKKTGSIRMEDGVEVAIGGSVEHYAAGGRVQMIMKMIDPNYTLGRLAESRELTLKRLASEGLLNRNRSLPMPVLPLRVALVTSEGSAAEADFMDELTQSGIPFEVSLFDARVQGTEAPALLARAIAAAGDIGVDVVAVIRGGGAKTDLVAFDNYEVAAAIAQCAVPVIVGVGHEIDRSICDEVAAVTAKTPTAAAGWIIQKVASFDQRVDQARQRLARAATNQITAAQQRCERSQRRLVAGATTALSSASRRHERVGTQLTTSTRAALSASNHRLERNELRRNALDPAAVMARGWTITRNAAGEVVSSITDVSKGEPMTVQTADGTIQTTVDGVETTTATISEDIS